MRKSGSKEICKFKAVLVVVLASAVIAKHVL